MSPTICHDSDTALEDDKMCENNDKNLNSKNNDLINENECMDPKDIDQGVEYQSANYDFPSDESQVKKRRKRKITEVDTVISSLSSFSTNSDDYGTDNELIAINKNKRRHKYSYRFAPLNVYHDLENDSKNQKFFRPDTRFNEQNMINKKNCMISIDERNMHPSSTSIDDFKKATMSTKSNNSNAKYLFEVAVATFKLIKKNQEFQAKLRELQTDTKNFINSIMENPENQSLREQFKLLS